MKRQYTGILHGALLGLVALTLGGCGATAKTDVNVAVYGPGTVTLPTGETCREPCSYPVTISPTQAWLNSYSSRLSAIADPGYELLSWNHPSCSPDSNTCSVPVLTECDYVAGPFVWHCLAWWVGYNRPEPVFLDMSTVSTVSHSPYSTCVIGHGGEVQCWGFPDADQVPPLSNPRQITNHRDHACVQDDSGLVCWGDALPGAPPRPLVEPYTLSAGYLAMCALDAQGVQCWRRNRGLEVPPLQTPTQLGAGSENHCVEDVSGTVCWEYDLNGSLVK